MKVGDVELRGERAVWWPATRTLLVADLHWGKEDTFHASGIPVPTIIDADLARLEAAIRATDAARVIVLGDLVHGPLLPTTIARITAFRQACPVSLVLVRGNHDRHAPELPAAWEIEEHRSILREGPYAFTHVPEPVAGHYTWAGHLHPTFTLRGRGDALRLPCFHLGRHVGVLPAFCAFSGGPGVRPGAGDGIYVVAEGRVIAIEGRALGRSRGYGR